MSKGTTGIKMALKDWKKSMYGYHHKVGMLEIGIYKLAKNKKWQVTRETAGSSASSKQLGLFKTKSQALKFAKDYMKLKNDIKKDLKGVWK
jgi:hypothetical protein